MIKDSLPGSDDRSADTTGTTKSLLGPDEHVGHVLVLAEQRDVEQDLKRLGVRRQDHELGLAPVEGLSRFVCALPQLLVVGRLLDEVEDLGRQGLVGEGVGLGVDFSIRHLDVVFELLLCDWLIPLGSAHH